MAEKVPILVVLGIDIDGKPHASRFAERDANFARRMRHLERADRDAGFQNRRRVGMLATSEHIGIDAGAPQWIELMLKDES